jgi:hypothetical protein
MKYYFQEQKRCTEDAWFTEIETTPVDNAVDQGTGEVING